VISFLFGVMLGGFIMTFVADFRDDYQPKVISQIVILVAAVPLSILEFVDGQTVSGILTALLALLTVGVLYLGKINRQHA